jgi:hypothetical protein
MSPLSHSPVFDQSVDILRASVESTNQPIGSIAIPQPSETGHGGRLPTSCNLLLSDLCLCVLEIVEYSRDPQGGDWPLTSSTLYRGFRYFLVLSEDFRLLARNRKREDYSERLIRRPLAEIKVWVGSGKMRFSRFLPAPPSAASRVFAESVVITAVFR